MSEINNLMAKVAALEDSCERLQAELREALETVAQVCDAFMIGEQVRDKQTIMTNLHNAIRRSNCLSAVENKFFTRTLVDDEEGEYEECYLSWGEEPAEYIKQFEAVLADRAERLLQEREGNSISDEMLNFLHGCGPLEGFHFGEIPPTERGQFWWRKRLSRPKDTP